jgi:hypothetical protein
MGVSTALAGLRRGKGWWRQGRGRGCQTQIIQKLQKLPICIMLAVGPSSGCEQAQM